MSSRRGFNELMQSLKDKRLARLLQLVFLISVFYLLWQLADGQQALGLLVDADPFLLMAGLLALTLQLLLSAFRWQITARQLGIVIGWKTAVREYYLSQIANQSLPGGFLGDASRVIRSKSHAGWVPSALAVVIERMAGQLALFVVFFVSLIVTFFSPLAFEIPWWLVIASGFLMIAMLTSLFLFSRAGGSNRTGLLAELSKAVAQSLFAREVRWLQLAIGLIAAGMNILGFYFASLAVGAELNVATAFVLAPLILLAMLMPISIGGWGVREAAAAALFPLAAASASQGLASSVAFGLVFLVATLPGILVSFNIQSSNKTKESGDKT